MHEYYFWRKLQLSDNFKPGDRYGHTTSLVGTKLYVHAGWKQKDSASFSDLWILDLCSMHWDEPAIKGPSPPSRGGHTAEVIGSDIWLFGGQNKHCIFNDVHVLDTETLVWTKHTFVGPQPEPRSQHVSFTVGANMYILLGHDGYGKMYNDLWVLDTLSLTWTKLVTTGTLPVAVGGATATLINNSLFVFGGRQSPHKYSDALYTLDVENLIWHEPEAMTGTVPSARAAHSSTLIGNEIFVFGGSNGKERLNDLYVLDTETQTWSQAKLKGGVPNSHSVHSATLVGSCVVVYGGFDGNECSGEIYILDKDTLIR